VSEGERRAAAPSAPSRQATPTGPTCDPDQAWKALTLVNDWVKHAETKSAATLAATGVSGGVLYNLVQQQRDPSLAVTIVGGICGAAIFLAGLFALLALTPRTNPLGGLRKQPPTSTASDDEGQEDPVNLLFFGDITRRYGDDSPTYAEVLGALTSNPEELTRHIARQVHANAGVAHSKYEWAGRAIWALAVALISLAGVAVLVGQRYEGG
jgi:hypothetical protein